MYCKNCGKNIEDGSKVCPYCGAQVQNNSLINDNGNGNFSGFVQKDNNKKGLIVLIAVIAVLVIGGIIATILIVNKDDDKTITNKQSVITSQQGKGNAGSNSGKEENKNNDKIDQDQNKDNNNQNNNNEKNNEGNNNNGSEVLNGSYVNIKDPQTGIMFTGTYVNGVKVGEGTLYCNGYTLEGVWDNDIIDFGTITYENGVVYIGEINNLISEGYGVIYYDNGYFDGSFVKGYLSEGIYYFDNGDIMSGEWDSNGTANGYYDYYEHLYPVPYNLHTAHFRRKDEEEYLYYKLS